jgi:hypothetical protein
MLKCDHPEVARANPCKEGQTIMSSSVVSKPAAVLMVQSGIVAWEDPVPIPDWRYKTATLIACKLSLTAELLRELITSRSQTLGHLFRLLIVPKPPSATASQIRRFVTQITADPPGFAGTAATAVNDAYWVVSELRDASVMDAGFLTDYRRCALVGTVLISYAADLSSAVGDEVLDLGGSGVAGLLKSDRLVAVIRTLDLGSHAVTQFVGSADVCGEVVQFFDEKQIRRIHDVHRIHDEIKRLCA